MNDSPGVPVAPRAPSNVDLAMNRLSETVSVLEHEFKKLNDVLSPVLKVEDPTADAPEPPHPPMSDLALSILHRVDHLRMMARRLKALHERIDL